MVVKNLLLKILVKHQRKGDFCHCTQKQTKPLLSCLVIQKSPTANFEQILKFYTIQSSRFLPPFPAGRLVRSIFFEPTSFFELARSKLKHSQSLVRSFQWDELPLLVLSPVASKEVDIVGPVKNATNIPIQAKL